MTPPGMASCTDTYIYTYTLQRVKKLSTNEKVAQNKEGTMLSTQSEFGLNTETALLFWKKKTPKVTFLFQVISMPGTSANGSQPTD